MSHKMTLLLYTKLVYFVHIMPKYIQPFVQEINRPFCFLCMKVCARFNIFWTNANLLVFFVDKRVYGVSWFRNEFMRFVIQKAFGRRKEVCDICWPITILV